MKNFFKHPLTYLMLATLLVGVGTLTISWSMVDDGKSAQVAQQISTAIRELDSSSFVKAIIEPDTGRFRPVYWLYQWVTFVIAGPSAVYHHLIHLVLFVVCTYIFYKLTSGAFKSLAVGFLASTLFIFDPLTLENWYRLGPQEPILIATILLSIMFYWRFRTLNQFKYLLLSALLFVFATLIKETAIAYIGIVFTFLVLDSAISTNRIYFKRDVLYLVIISLIIVGTRFMAFKAYPLIGYAAMYKLDTSILVNAQAFYKVIGNTYGPLIHFLFVTFLIRFIISVNKNGFLSSLPIYYWQIISLAWFVSFLSIQLPWAYTLGRYLQPAFLGMFAFMASELLVIIKFFEEIIIQNKRSIKRIDVNWIVNLFKVAIYFVLIVILCRNLIINISYFTWVKGISDFDNDLVTRIIPYAKNGNQLYFNADKGGEPLLEIFEGMRWHLIYIYGIKDLHFEYLPMDYVPKKQDVVITHNYKQIIPIVEIQTKLGFTNIANSQIDIYGVTITTPTQIIKNIPMMLFGLSVEKSQIDKIYAIAKYSYQWHLYEKE